MNILEIEDIIKGLPDQSLIQEAQAPSGQMPQFLVVSEIQRRADMRKRFQNQQQEMPQGTIAQQIVQGGIASMGNQQPIQPMPPQGMPQQGMPPQGMPPMPQQGMPQGMPQQGMPMQQQPPMMPPMSPPMMPPAQGMAAGGVVRMQAGTQTPYTGGTGASYIYRDSIFNPERFSSMMEMNAPNYSLVGSGLGFNPQENLLNRNENVPAQQARSPSIGSSVLKDKLAEALTKEETQRFPYTGGLERPELRTGASYIYRDSIFNPENIGTEAGDLLRKQQIDSLLENFPSTPMSRQAATAEQNIRDVYGESGFGAAVGQALREIPEYGISVGRPIAEAGGKAIQAGLTGIDLATREPARALEQLFTGEIKDTKPLFFTPATDFSGFDSEVDKFLSPYLNPSFDVSSDAAGGNAQKADTKRFGEGTKTANPETTAEAIETGMNTGSSEKTVQKDLSKDSDYSSLQAAIDQFKPVDYSAFKPDYLNLITEQERRAQKIRDDASKDASAQALIQLGAGLAAGDISKGLSAAGQSVADIKRQARAEARDEEGFARQLRLAQDEAGMQLGIKGAEAEREMARFKATYGVSLKELENTMTLAREQIAAEANTEAGRALRGELDALNNLIKNLMSEQYEGDIEQNKAAIAQAVSRMQFLLGITGEKQDKEKDPLGIGV
jgi:hypothetical protein